MLRLAVLVAILAVCPLLSSQCPDAKPQKTHTVKLNGHTFTLPAGFTIELAVKPGLVDRPIVADFDDQGRLYVADSSGSNEKVTEQVKKRPHRIIRLEDTNGDGVYDKRTVFADKMMFPEGLMWHEGSVYVAAPPSIWKLTDADNDGVAEKRVEWFDGKTLTGCANDLHGPYAGPDGWIYWCKGAFAEQRYKRPGKKDFVTKASHIFRARPDGSGIEAVMTGGMDNPVDVVFMPSGERIFTTTFFQHPAGGLRDGLIHAVYGGVWGKDHHVVYPHPWTSPELMPVLSHMGPAAPAGLHRYTSERFGREYRDNLFAVQFNMAKVSRHALTPKGATYTSRDVDFLVSSNRDFHPTDVIEDADGSLLVIDTGGWYKLCCPTSQLVKPDVLGAIYRIRRTDAAKVVDPRGAKIAWAKAEIKDLISLLDDSRSVVRQRAVRALAARGEKAIPALAAAISKNKSERARLNAVWTTTRIEGAKARAAVRLGLGDESEQVVQATLHSISLWRDSGAREQLVKLLACTSAHNRRAAAEALGRIGDAKSVPALLEAAGKADDRYQEHSIVYALIEIGDREETSKGLKNKSASTRRAALIALGEMDGKAESAPVLAELDSPDARLREAAWWVAGRHPEWGELLAEHFTTRLKGIKALAERKRSELSEQMSRFTSSPVIQTLIATRLAQKTSSEEKRLLLWVMATTRVKQVPEKWRESLLEPLTGSDNDVIRAAIRTARALPINGKDTPKLLTRLRSVGENEKLPADIRVGALSAIPGNLGAVDAGLFNFLSGCVSADKPVSERGPAAGALSRSRLTREQLLKLAAIVKTAGPMELDPLLEPFGRGKDEAVGLALLSALKASEVRSSLHIDRLRTRLQAYSDAVKKQAETLIVEIDADSVARRKQIDDLIDLAKKGDVRRGQAVFNNEKTACISCHAIGYVGGKIGPDLTRIGKIRDERDLLESILFPSASFVRSYEPVQVTTKKGQSFNGLVREESSAEIVLQINATEQKRIARSDIEELHPSKVSIMPAGLDKVLTKQELADLVAFLKKCQ